VRSERGINDDDDDDDNNNVCVPLITLKSTKSGQTHPLSFFVIGSQIMCRLHDYSYEYTSQRTGRYNN